MLNLPRDGQLEPLQEQELKEFLLSSEQFFSVDEDDLGCTSLVHHKITVLQSNRLHAVFHFTEELVDDTRKKGIIQPSVSAWASPIVLVPKRDNT